MASILYEFSGSHPLNLRAWVPLTRFHALVFPELEDKAWLVEGLLNELSSGRPTTPPDAVRT